MYFVMRDRPMCFESEVTLDGLDALFISCGDF